MCAALGWAVSVDAVAEVPASTPTRVHSWTGRLAAGNSHTCLVRVDGAVFCWGDNTYGQLGNSAFPDSSSTTPVQVAALPDGRTAVQVTAGANHSCVKADEGTVWCWGYGGFVELGSAIGNQSEPVNVNLGSGIFVSRVIAGGNTTCASTTDDNLTCWGRNNKGQIGNGTTKSSGGVAPTAVSLVPSSFTVRDIDPGGSHMCAASDAGAVWCWGADAKLQLGTKNDGTGGVLDKTVPTLTDSTGGAVRSVATGDNFSCTVRGTGVAVCWGDNASGQLAQPLSTTSNATPTPVSLASKVTKLVAGGSHACALTSAGEVWCWGSNSWGQVGDGTPDARKTVPSLVATLGAPATDVVAGQNHTCALLVTAAVKCWGSNSAGQIGSADGLPHDTPVTVEGLDEGATVESPVSYSITEDSAVVSGMVSVPVGEATVKVERSTSAGFGTVAESAALGTWGRAVVASTSSGHGCVVLPAGTVSCRGSNTDGQLGNRTVGDSVDPVNVAWDGRAVDVSAGGRHTCAVESAGGVWCWGANDQGQLGDGATDNSATPVQVALDTGQRAVGVSAGSTSTCTLLDTGTVRCWGSNGSGELGNGSTSATRTIVTVPLGDPAVEVSVGDQRACAVLVTGDAKCWGVGIPGDGSTGGSSTPVFVALPSASVRQVVTGSGHSCALVAGGEVKCWGSDATVGMAVPVTVSFGAGAEAVLLAASGAATCARLATGVVECVGEAGDARMRATQALDPSTAPSHSLRTVNHGFTVLPAGTQQWYRFSVSHGGTVTRTEVATFTTATTTTTSTTTTTTTTTTSTTTLPPTTDAPSTSITSTSTSTSTTSTSTTTTTTVPATLTTQPAAPGIEATTSTFGGTTIVSPILRGAVAPDQAAPNVAGQQPVVQTARPEIVTKIGRSVSAARIASKAGLHIPRRSEGRLRLSIVSGLRQCRFVGSSVRAQRIGSCTIRVSLIRNRGVSTTFRLRIRIGP